MFCEGCKSNKAISTRLSLAPNGNKTYSCDQCSKSSIGYIPDVYLGNGETSCEHIADPKTGQPIPYSSKHGKLAAMKQAGVTQSPSAERQHGYRNNKYLNRKVYG